MLVDTTHDDPITTIRLNRPEKLNALNEALITDLNTALTETTRTTTNAILLTGNGRATCAGMDTDIVGTDEYKNNPHMGAMNRETRAMLREHDYPTAMAAKGAVVGAGFGFACHCDLVVLGEDTHFSYPEIEYGLVASSTTELADLVGDRVAKEIVLTADTIDPHRAKTLGLVNDVVPEDTVETRTRELLEQIMQHDPEMVTRVLDEFN